MNLKFILILLFISFTSPKVHIQLAYSLAQYNRITYMISKVTEWNCDGCNDVPLIDRVSFSSSKYNLFGYAGYSEKYQAIIIAIRGSVISVRNLITNIDYLDISYSRVKGGKVHKNFYNAWKSLKPSFITAINPLLKTYSKSNLYVTGHSLGGALAVLAASYLTNLHQVTSVYTFGQPRVGNKKFSGYIDSILDVYRFINRNDPIPSVPLRKSMINTVGNKIKQTGLSIKKGASKLFSKGKKFFHLEVQPLHDSYFFFNYHHEGDQLWCVPEDKKIYYCEAEEKDCHDSVPAYKKNPKDHLIINYLKTLKTAIAQKWKIQ